MIICAFAYHSVLINALPKISATPARQKANIVQPLYCRYVEENIQTIRLVLGAAFLNEGVKLMRVVIYAMEQYARVRNSWFSRRLSRVTFSLGSLGNSCGRNAAGKGVGQGSCGSDSRRRW